MFNLAVWIHNQTSPPEFEKQNNYNGDMLWVSNSFETQLVIEREFQSKLEEPYGSCLKNASQFKLNKTLVKHFEAEKEAYNYVNCLEHCFDLSFIEKNNCNCSKATTGNVWEKCYHSNENSDDKGCTFQAKLNFYKSNYYEYCANYCPLECDTIKYVVNVNSVSIPPPDEAIIVAYYRSLKYAVSNQQPKEQIIDFVTDVGGLLGLFIGISFMSFVEIVHFFSEIVFFLFAETKILSFVFILPLYLAYF